MLVVLSGGTGVIGRAAVRSLVSAGHDVTVVSRSPGNDEIISVLGATPRRADLFDPTSLATIYEGADAVVNLATHVPVGYSASLGFAWREHERLRTRGVRSVIEAARKASVRRVVQESVSFLYADRGDAWITEQSPVEITSATEPTAVTEATAQDYACDSRTAVILRFGRIVGDDDQTRFWLRAAESGRPCGIGAPDAWSHLVHTDDLGPAVLAALHAPTGVYNVGAEPVLGQDVLEAYAKVAGSEHASFLGPLLRRFSGNRTEPLRRSLRVSSEHFAAQTGWRPRRPAFDPSWLETAVPVAAGS